MAPGLVLGRSLRSIPSTTADALSSSSSSLDGPLMGPADGPLREAGRLYGRGGGGGDYSKREAAHGVLDPHDINNVGFFVLFALIGVAFVVTGIWFFFWAKNGGFHFKEGDWDEYKSTVLRRKGPNGTLLSGATRSTKLGGGSVYKDVRDDEDGTTVVTDSTGLSGITAGASDIAARERRRAKQEQRDRERRRRRREEQKTTTTPTTKHRRRHGEAAEEGRHVGEDGVMDEVAEKEALKELRSYRHEKAARVGGLNKESDGSQWDGSTNPSESAVSASDTPTTMTMTTTTRTTTTATAPTKSKAGAIRKVYSTAERNEQREAERIRAEARRLREESRSSRRRRRDFSYNRPEASDSAAMESLLEGEASDLGVRRSLVSVPEEGRTVGTAVPGGRDRHRDRERERERERHRERRERREGRTSCR
ncbi:hypothetical protein E4U41_001542 [Claviceps citrina]|nr:hypothetical protein E4U41_001542 [Claviceps citrina]